MSEIVRFDDLDNITLVLDESGEQKNPSTEMDPDVQQATVVLEHMNAPVAERPMNAMLPDGKEVQVVMNEQGQLVVTQGDAQPGTVYYIQVGELAK